MEPAFVGWKVAVSPVRSGHRRVSTEEVSGPKVSGRRFRPEDRPVGTGGRQVETGERSGRDRLASGRNHRCVQIDSDGCPE